MCLIDLLHLLKHERFFSIAFYQFGTIMHIIGNQSVSSINNKAHALVIYLYSPYFPFILFNDGVKGICWHFSIIIHLLCKRYCIYLKNKTMKISQNITRKKKNQKRQK